VADNQQVGIVGFPNENRASRPADHPLLYGNSCRPIGNPRQRGRRNLGEFPPGPRFLFGFWRHRFGSDRCFPASGHDW
jgi:hypothetical protein